MKKPLYIHAKKPLTIKLDGRALTTSGENLPVQRYPLSRVARVIISGQFSWRTNAIKACMQEGIPVVFMDDKGHPLGMVLGHSVRVTPLCELIEAFLERPDWPPLQRNWFHARQREIILKVLPKLHAPDKLDLRPKSLHNQLHRIATTHCSKRQYKYLLNVHKSCLTAMVCQVIKERKLGPVIMTAREHGFNLINNLVQLMSWYLKPLQLKIVQQPTGADRFVEKQLVTQFENRSESLKFKCAQLLDSLDHWLRSLT